MNVYPYSNLTNKSLQGVTDTHLNENGIGQARKLARRLAKFEIHNFYSSDLSRALRTAEEIAKDRQIFLDDRLREFDLGIFAGFTHVSCLR